jgi:hypothetical protein
MVLIAAGPFWMGSDERERDLARSLSSEAVRAARWFDAELARAVRYAEARRLGQLGAPRVRVVPEAAVRFLDGGAALGTRRGAVKPASLILQSDLARRLLGHFRAPLDA